MSESTLSRYRNGMRKPAIGSAPLNRLTRGIARLCWQANPKSGLRLDDVKAVFEAELSQSCIVGMSFNDRFDATMKVLGVRNAEMAEACGVDQSFISRIRHSKRMPADLHAFLEQASRLLAHACMDNHLIDSLANLIMSVYDVDERSELGLDSESDLTETIASWLAGDCIVASDVADMKSVLAWLNELATVDLSFTGCFSTHPRKDIASMRRFYYGTTGLSEAEAAFFKCALESNARDVYLNSDAPLMLMGEENNFIIRIQRYIDALAQNGCRIHVVNNVERPLSETLKLLRMWVPHYISGQFVPYHLKGLTNRLFCHATFVCDACALSSESLIGHQEDGRHFLTTRPIDIYYYQRKMDFIIEASTSLLGLYHENDPQQREEFHLAERARQESGGGKRIAENKYPNLRITLYPADCAVLSLLAGDNTVHFVIRHPKILFVLGQIE